MRLENSNFENNKATLNILINRVLKKMITTSLKYYASFFLFTVVQISYGQFNKINGDSLRQRLTKDSAWIYRPRKVFPLLAIDQRNSFLRTSRNSNAPVNVWGAKAGVTLFDRHNVGIGGYSIQSASSRINPRDGITTSQNLTFQYLTAFYEYSFIQTRWWEIGIPIEAGYGIYKVTSTNLKTDQVLAPRKGGVFPMGTALDIYFKPTNWFAINLMGGYRYVLNNTSRLDLSGWFYSVGGAVYIRQIIQDSRYFFKKRKYKRDVAQVAF